MITTSPLNGQTILVTGASRGIGRAIAVELGKVGAHVVLVARSASALEEVEDVIHGAGGSATIAPLDLTDKASIARLGEAIGVRWDALDGLVLNAAILGSLAPAPALDVTELHRVFAVNFFAPQALIATFDPMLRRARSGKLIAITSRIGREPTAFWGGYGASKAALDNLVSVYADEVANISPLCCALVDPGANRTQMRAKAFPGEEPLSVRDPAVTGRTVAGLFIDGFANGAKFRVNDAGSVDPL